MTSLNTRDIGWSLLAWLGIGVFWLAVTRSFHPTLGLAVLVTASLVTAYAAAAFLNHLVFLPRLRRTHDHREYFVCQIGTMLALTASALTIIRIGYYVVVGPDLDPVLSTAKHYAIDLIGMAAHVGAAAIAVWYVQKVRLAAAGR